MYIYMFYSILDNNPFDFFLLHELDQCTTVFTTGLQSKEYHEHCTHRHKQRYKTTQYDNFLYHAAKTYYHVFVKLIARIGCFYDTSQDQNCTCTKLLNFNYNGRNQIITT